MCGICGQVNADRTQPIDRELLGRMNAALRHRGPDSGGFYVDHGVGLAMRRLAIIDLSTGDQPLSNEDGSIWIVFNGEIYNFLELRDELERRGHRFCTRSDTEAIVHGYEEYGDEVVNKLNGMFAFAIWDAKQERLLLARDRLGKKPLYYYHDGGRLIFASELKALLQDTTLPRRISLAALWHYLTLQYVPDPLSIFDGVNKLPPAHILIWQSGRIHLRRYWDLCFEPKLELSEGELIRLVRESLTRAVRMRLISDVPLGAFLSGGIDSSIVVGLMAEASPQPVKTFSIGFEEEQFSELPYARLIARRFDTDHHEFIVRYADALDALPELARALDEPFADSSALPVYYLSWLTRRHVTVALNGDGGDETFAGYQRYLLDRYARLYTALPDVITQRIVPALLSLSPEPLDVPIEANVIAGLKRLSQVAAITPKADIVRWGSYFSEEMKAGLCTPAVAAALDGLSSAALLADSFDRAPARSFLDRTLYVDSTNYLPGDLLVKADRMSMAHSLEARSPFLDYRFVELAARLPGRYKLRGRAQKYLLKKTFADLLPQEIGGRGKRGFGIPVGHWFRAALKPLAWDTLLSPRTAERGYFRQEAVKGMLIEHETGRVDHGKRIWALVMLELWHQNYAGVR